MNRLLQEYFSLLPTKLFKKSDILISACMPMSFCKSCSSSTSGDRVPPLPQCHLSPLDACLSLWPHTEELFASIWCLGMAKSEWQTPENLEQTESISQGSCPDEQPRWLARGQISFKYAPLYIDQTFLFSKESQKGVLPLEIPSRCPVPVSQAFYHTAFHAHNLGPWRPKGLAAKYISKLAPYLPAQSLQSSTKL